MSCFILAGVPLAIVCLVLAIDKDAYGNTRETAVAAKSKITNEL